MKRAFATWSARLDGSAAKWRAGKPKRKNILPGSVPELIEKFLGPPQYIPPEVEKQDEVGVVQSLAWTENGGEIMPVEVAVLEGKGYLQMTGQIGRCDAGVRRRQR